MKTLDTTIKTSFSSELYRQFGWYNDIFLPPVQEASDIFFDKGFEFKLVSISENMNLLARSETFFVSKVEVAPKNNILIRISRNAVSVILDKVLGKTNKKFELSEITDLEAKIITSFNDFLYEKISDNINKDNIIKHPEEINLSYFIRNLSSDESARVVISIPRQMLNPKTLAEPENPLNDHIFKDAQSEVGIHIGSTMFSMKDVKNISVGDIVIFENSHAGAMTLVCDNILQEFNVTLNEEIIIPYYDSGDNDMDNNEQITNLWDSLQVEMSAEFDKIRISLGELKDIQEGLVVDISPVYNNKISLKVGDKIVAKGELVIINDRYGVKVSDVTAEDNVEENIESAHKSIEEEVISSDVLEESIAPPEQQDLQQEVVQEPQEEIPVDDAQSTEDFNYNDFDIDSNDV